MNTKNTNKDPQVVLQDAIDKGVEEITEISKKTVENLQNAAQGIVLSTKEELEKTVKENKNAPQRNQDIGNEETFVNWLMHTLHYPGDEKAEKILNDFEAAEKVEAKRRQKVKDKLGRK